ncbi:DUF547 domain-containing protein [Changchengzhania lutea]|uniref:DUF547 domain-containing protein n=1 Tax=Changchengzhania lutea TaxID=2049305 RepID=UPI00115E0D87|nr:DUF547 domain-containing protein [Changchengzhania lutea]
MKYLILTFISLLFNYSACTNAPKAVSNTTQTTSVGQTKTTDSLLNNDIKLVDSTQNSLTTKQKAFNHELWNTLLQQYVSEDGQVNYKAFKKNKEKLSVYIENLSKNVPDSSWKRNEVLAYWINAYNALTIDLIIKNYPVNSIKDIKNPWDQALWQFGDKQVDLNHIEHDILRKMNEPRIHFAIVCASYSCPKLANTAYTSNDLEAQLTAATKTFLSNEKRNKIAPNKIEISKIFKWFDDDFKKNGSLINFLNQYTDITISEKARMSFKDYNWELNE